MLDVVSRRIQARTDCLSQATILAAVSNLEALRDNLERESAANLLDA